MRRRTVPGQMSLQAGSDSGFQLQAAEGEKKLRKFSMTAYTGASMQFWWSRHPVIVDLAGMRISAKSRPIFRDHDPGRIVGHTESIEIEKSLRLTGFLSAANEHAREVMDSADNGFPWQCSIGASINKIVFVEEGDKVQVNGRSFTGPVYVVKSSTLQEVSFVALGADDNTSARVAASAASNTPEIEVGTMKFEQWLEAQGFKSETLSEQQIKFFQALYDTEQERPTGGKPATSQLDLQAAFGQFKTDLQAELKAEREKEGKRLAAIRKVCGTRFPEIEARAIAEGWSEQQTELEVLRAGRPSGPAIHAGGSEGVSGPAIEAALLGQVAGVDSKFLAKHYDAKTLDLAASSQYRGCSIQGAMEITLRAAGQHHAGSRKGNDYIRSVLNADRQLQASSGFSTLSLSGILSTVANKALIASYEAVEVIWPFICAVRNHSDFKVHTRYRLDSSGSFKKVGADGEIKHISLTDASYTNQLDTYGAMISLTRQMIVNDDLGAFMEIPQILGRMSAVRLEEAVFVLLLSNPSSFFHANNKNLMTGSDTVLDIDSLSTARKKFRDRVDPNGKPILISPRILLVGTALETTALDLFESEKVEVTTTAEKRRFATNPHQNLYRPYVSPYLNNTDLKDESGAALSSQSATQWYLFADPNVRAAMAVAFLNGQRVPVIESAETDFNTLGMQWRAYHDFGVGMEDPVAAIRSAGA